MKRMIIVAAVCALACSSALADITVSLVELSTDPAGSVTVSSSGYDGGALAGVYKLHIKDPSAGYTGPLGYVDSFCIDIWDLTQPGYTTYTVVGLDQAPDLGAGPMGNVKAADLAELLNKNWVAGMTPTQKTALQLAVWEVVDELSSNSYDISSGQFSATGDGSVITEATNMLATITTGASSWANYLALTTTLDQDYVVKVPLPGAVLLGAIGLIAAGRKLRKLA